MKMHTTIFAVLIGLVASGSLSVAGEEHPTYEGSQAFQQMKQLAGHWEGTMDMGKGPEKIKASYRVTSAGSTLVETIFEGTPNEMVTIYHDDKNRRLGLTHYCGLNNRPEMVLIGNSENTLEFDLAGDAPIDAAHEPHMHALTLTFAGRDEMQQHWTQFADGKKQKVVVISYKRVLPGKNL
ncbi:MAG: hypothetical protein E2O43_01795 [Nitrospina sp.]|nr:MAG: hypothetical protein E2O43_01795 [Nitrospina sp.]